MANLQCRAHFTDVSNTVYQELEESEEPGQLATAQVNALASHFGCPGFKQPGSGHRGKFQRLAGRDLCPHAKPSVSAGQVGQIYPGLGERVWD